MKLHKISIPLKLLKFKCLIFLQPLVLASLIVLLENALLLSCSGEFLLDEFKSLCCSSNLFAFRPLLYFNADMLLFILRSLTGLVKLRVLCLNAPLMPYSPFLLLVFPHLT